MRQLAHVALLLALAVSGCGEESGLGGGSDEGLSGQAVLADDTGLGDSVDPGGWILVVPGSEAAGFWEQVGLEEPDDLAHAQVAIDTERAEAAGAELVEVDADGGFRIDQSGDTLLCRVADSGSTRGCHRVELPASGELRASQGEGGFFVSVED